MSTGEDGIHTDFLFTADGLSAALGRIRQLSSVHTDASVLFTADR